MRDVVTTGGNALPRDDEPDVTRFKSPVAKRVQAHRARLAWAAVPDRSGSDRTVSHLISTGYLSLERSEEAAAVAHNARGASAAGRCWRRGYHRKLPMPRM